MLGSSSERRHLPERTVGHAVCSVNSFPIAPLDRMPIASFRARRVTSGQSTPTFPPVHVARPTFTPVASSLGTSPTTTQSLANRAAATRHCLRPAGRRASPINDRRRRLLVVVEAVFTAVPVAVLPWLRSIRFSYRPPAPRPHRSIDCCPRLPIAPQHLGEFACSSSHQSSTVIAKDTTVGRMHITKSHHVTRSQTPCSTVSSSPSIPRTPAPDLLSLVITDDVAPYCLHDRVIPTPQHLTSRPGPSDPQSVAHSITRLLLATLLLGNRHLERITAPSIMGPDKRLATSTDQTEHPAPVNPAIGPNADNHSIHRGLATHTITHTVVANTHPSATR